MLLLDVMLNKHMGQMPGSMLHAQPVIAVWCLEGLPSSVDSGANLFDLLMQQHLLIIRFQGLLRVAQAAAHVCQCPLGAVAVNLSFQLLYGQLACIDLHAEVERTIIIWHGYCSYHPGW